MILKLPHCSRRGALPRGHVRGAGVHPASCGCSALLDLDLDISPPRWRKFLTWVQGWFTWTGYVALLTSCPNGNTVVLEGIVQFGSPDYSSGGWHTTLIMFAAVASCTGVNLFAFWLVPWFEVSVFTFSSIAIPQCCRCAVDFSIRQWGGRKVILISC